MPYTYPTLLQARIALASRLNDPGNVRWVAQELDVYLREALRTWNAWTATFRDRGSFTTTMNEPFYDVPTVLPLLRGYTVSNWDLITDLQYALMEPAAPGGTWTGTEQFTLDQLSLAIQRRRDQFLRETGVVLTRTVTTYLVPPGDGRIDLGEAVVAVRRAAWRPLATQFLAILQRTTEWAGANFSPAWRQSVQPPSCYSVTTAPPPDLQLIPPTSNAGELDILTLNIGVALDTTFAAPLGIPDDFAWVVKYGALADLLNGDGLALDSSRAAYCEQRWQQGIDQARRAPVILAAYINSVTCRIASISDADSYTPTWQLLAGIPQYLLMASQNIIATCPPPGGTGGPWTIALDVVRNAPVPFLDGDVLQIDQSVYDAVLDVAQHTALFKEGDGEVEQAMQLLERAARLAGIVLKFEQAQTPDRAAIRGQQQQDRRSLPEQLADVIPVPVED